MDFQQAIQWFKQDPCLPGLDDPYRVYAALREESAIHWCEGPKLWMIVAYQEAVDHMKDARFSRQSHLDELIARFGYGHIFERQKNDLPYMDGREHARLRHHVTQAYRGIDFQLLATFTQAFLRDRFQAIAGEPVIDLVREIANPLPVMVVSELMGVPSEQQEMVCQKVGAFVRARGLTQTQSTVEEGDDSMGFYNEYFLPLIREKRQHLSTDLLSRLISDHQENMHLTDEQLLLVISSNFYSASIYTLRLLVGTVAWALSLHPEVYTRIRADRQLVAPALEEVLRWDPPAQAINAGTALEDMEIDGKIIRAGESVSVLVSAANRDPRVFEHPDQFLIDRNPNHHLSFAPGLHQCLGLHLARMEGACFLNALCDHFESLEVVEGESRRLLGDRFRGFDRLLLKASPV